MATFSFNEQLQYVIGEMHTISQKLQETLKVLDDGTTMRLSEWADTVRGDYDVAKMKWDAAAADMVTQANNATQQLGVITEAYHAGQNYGVQLWDR